MEVPKLRIDAHIYELMNISYHKWQFHALE